MRRAIRKLLQRTPIAWLQVSNNPTKMLIGIAGVSFSNLLMFFQLRRDLACFEHREYLEQDLVRKQRH